MTTMITPFGSPIAVWMQNISDSQKIRFNDRIVVNEWCPLVPQPLPPPMPPALIVQLSKVPVVLTWSNSSR